MAEQDMGGQDTGVAVLGTGIMGSAMARNVIAAGFRTTVWDGSPSATAPLSEAGALVAAFAERRGPRGDGRHHHAADR